KLLPEDPRQRDHAGYPRHGAGCRRPSGGMRRAADGERPAHRPQRDVPAIAPVDDLWRRQRDPASADRLANPRTGRSEGLMPVLSDQERMIEESVAGLLGRRGGAAGLRKKAAQGALDHELWAEAAAAGWTGMLVPESVGGSGLDIRDALVMLRGIGR